jgi:hypothetical protein
VAAREPPASGTLAGMSPTARVALTVVCWTLALVTELSGIALLVLEARRTGRALRRWRDLDAAEPALLARQQDLDGVVELLAGRSFDRAFAISLLVVGVVAGALGNFLSL